MLYVDDAALCRRFWIDQIGMVVKSVTQAGGHEVARVGFADLPFAWELVTLELMAHNPDGLDLATPSACFGVEVTEINSHAGMLAFAFSDPEGR